MGFTPQQIDDMSLWQFMATLEGWRVANGAEPRIEPPSEDEFEAWLEGSPLNGE